MQNKWEPIQKKIGLLQPDWPVAASVGIILFDDWCGKYQPAVGSTIPWATDPELCKEVSWARPDKKHPPVASTSRSYSSSCPDSLQ